MISKIIYKVFGLFITFYLPSAMAANIYEGKDTFGDPIIKIEGEIQAGDLDEVVILSRSLLLRYPDVALSLDLNSPGGDALEAMKIGQFARDLLAKVQVLGTIIDVDEGLLEETLNTNPDDAHTWQYDREKDRSSLLSENDIRRCYSACVYIFYGGVERIIRDNADRRTQPMRTIPIIGLHRPYFSQQSFSTLSPGEAREGYRQLEESVREYMRIMGAPQAIADRMFRSASNEVDLVSAEEFKQYYHDKEPFLEEWLISKCGSTGEENVLSGIELQRFRDLSDLQLKELRRRRSLGKNTDNILGGFVPSGFTEEEVKRLYSAVRFHNRYVDACISTAITEHQHEWAVER